MLKIKKKGIAIPKTLPLNLIGSCGVCENVFTIEDGIDWHEVKGYTLRRWLDKEKMTYLGWETKCPVCKNKIKFPWQIKANGGKFQLINDEGERNDE